MAKFTLNFVTPDGKSETKELERISIPTSDGIRTLLANHMELMAPIETGEVVLIEDQNNRESYIVSEGLFHFKDNEATLMVRTFESADEIDKHRAESAKERAKERLQAGGSRLEMEEAELALKRAIARLRV